MQTPNRQARRDAAHRIQPILALIVLLGLAVAGCTRRATTGAIPTATGVDTGGGDVGSDATMEALRAGMLTQTAALILGGGGIIDITDTPEPPTATPVPTETPTPTPVGPTTYTVQPGDWIYKIARDHGVDPQALIDANPGVDPNHIEPGQVLNIPAPAVPGAVVEGAPTAAPTTYTVQVGDWIYKIARQLGKDPDAIIAANPGIDPNNLIPGQVLNIP